MERRNPERVVGRSALPRFDESGGKSAQARRPAGTSRAAAAKPVPAKRASVTKRITGASRATTTACPETPASARGRTGAKACVQGDARATGRSVTAIRRGQGRCRKSAAYATKQAADAKTRARRANH